MKNVWQFQCLSYNKRDPSWTHIWSKLFQTVTLGRRLPKVLNVKQRHVLNRFPSTLYGQGCFFDHYSNMQLQSFIQIF